MTLRTSKLNNTKTHNENHIGTQITEFNMEVKFVHHPENDICKGVIGESILYEIKSPFIPSKPYSKYFLNCYKCKIVANLGDHERVEIKDGVVSIWPSILCPRESCKEHYFIKNGIVC